MKLVPLFASLALCATAGRGWAQDRPAPGSTLGDPARVKQILELYRRAQSDPSLRRPYVDALLRGEVVLPELQQYYDAKVWADSDSAAVARRRESRKMPRIVAELRLLDDKISAAAMRPKYLRSLEAARAKHDTATGAIEATLYQVTVPLWQTLPDAGYSAAAASRRVRDAALRKQAATQRGVAALVRQAAGQQRAGQAGSYEGGKLNNRPEGRGTETYANGDRYVGGFHLGRRHGHGVLEAANGTRFEGRFTDGDPSGALTVDLPSGTRYVGALVNGHRSGEGTLELATGERYVGGFSEDRFEGHGVLEYADGRRYDGQWHNGKREGHAVEEYANGRTLRGRFADDRFVEPDKLGPPIPSRVPANREKRSSGSVR